MHKVRFITLFSSFPPVKWEYNEFSSCKDNTVNRRGKRGSIPSKEGEGIGVRVTDNQFCEGKHESPLSSLSSLPRQSQTRRTTKEAVRQTEGGGGKTDRQTPTARGLILPRIRGQKEL